MSDNIPPKTAEKRISESTLIKVQAISGLVVASYLSLHFVSIACANFGPATFNNVLNILREAYQYPVYEIPMVLSIPIHMIAGNIRINRRHERESHSTTIHTQNPTISFQENQLKWHRRAAKFISFAIIGHFSATRIFPQFAGIYPNFSWMQYTLTWPYGIIFVPYYVLLGMSGAYHLMNGLYYALRNLGMRKILPKNTDKVAYYSGIMVGAVAVSAVVAFAGSTGHKDTSSFNAINNYFFGSSKHASRIHEML
eukprot:Phypoly_transcript_14369.p1 GENE.Phypoly_transcript_14369~~Phypoly_transcript_14369.p1  ORF type:complete len:254 (+),score=25.40 Phypoly_transcript_14369:198-959(+)